MSLSLSSSLTVSIPPSTIANLFTPTQTQNVAFTTPFIRPSDCREYWEETISLSTSYDAGYTTYSNGSSTWTSESTVYAVPVVYSNPARVDEYGSCQPPRWRERVKASRHDYQPAVCPDRWVALDMSDGAKTIVESGTTIYSKLSTAYCCKSGWSIARDISMGDITGHCVTDYTGFANNMNYSIATATATPESSDASITFRAWTTDYAIHPPWRIAWDKRDTKTMTPRPPDLTNEMRIPAWTPGMSIPFGQYYHNGSGRNESDSNHWASLILFMQIGTPLISIAILSCCCWCCFSCRRTRRRENQRREGEAWIVAENNARLSNVEEVRQSERNEGREERRDEDQLPPYSKHTELGPAYVETVELRQIIRRESGRPS